MSVFRSIPGILGGTARVGVVPPNYSVTLTKPFTVEGDSISAGNLAGSPYQFWAILANYVVGTITNRAVGSTTSATIASSVAGESTTQKSGWVSLEMGRNDTSSVIGSTGIVSTIMSNYASSVALMSGKYAVIGSPNANIEPYGDPALAQCMSVSRKLAALYPNSFIDWRYLLRQYSDGSANDNADIAAGYTPRSTRTMSDNSVNSLHPGVKGDKIIAYYFALPWLRAVEGAGVYAMPYEEIHLTGSAAATAQTNGGYVTTLPFQGTPDTCVITGGDTVNFTVNSSGTVTRATATVLDVLYSDITFTVKKGTQTSAGKIRIFIGASDTSCSDTTFDGTYFMVMPDAPTGLDSSKISGYVAFAPGAFDATSMYILGNENLGKLSIERTTANRIRITGKNSANTTVLSIQTTATITNASGITWVFFSADLSGAGGSANCRVYVNETSSLSFTTGTGSSTISLNNRLVIGAQSQANASPYKGQLREIALFNDFIDWSISARRAEVYNSTTKAAIGLPANGAVNSIVPFLWMPGNNADRGFGYNLGTAGDFVTMLPTS